MKFIKFLHLIEDVGSYPSIFTISINQTAFLEYGQIAYKVLLLLNQIKQQKMTEKDHRSPQYEQLLEVRKKLFTDSAPKNNNQNSSKKKQVPSSPILQTPTKKIQLKRHLKTEIASTTPRGVKEARLKTSPNGVSPLSRIQQHRGSNAQHASRANKSAFEEQSKNNVQDHFRSQMTAKTETDLFPSGKKTSLAYSRIYRDSKINKSTSNSKEKELLSKSRKRMMFTVYNSKEKSQQKDVRSTKIEYEVPYRFSSSVTIDLLNHSPSKINCSKSKQKNRDSSQDKIKVSKVRTATFHTLSSLQDPRIAKALTKIQTYKFVFEYLTKTEVIEKLSVYTHLKEPQCKWVLLIIDEVFKKMKNNSNYQ